jgi:hypothetical protein
MRGTEVLMRVAILHEFAQMTFSQPLQDYFDIQINVPPSNFVMYTSSSIAFSPSSCHLLPEMDDSTRDEKAEK